MFNRSQAGWVFRRFRKFIFYLKCRLGLCPRTFQISCEEPPYRILKIQRCKSL